MYNFTEKARGVHGDKYDYSKVKYINNHTKVCIICPEHGEFWQTPNNHLHGYGCPKCKSITIGNLKRQNVNDFINKANVIHKNKYDYSKVEYVNNSTKVCIICPEHGEFWQTPNAHLSGHGCSKCKNVNKSDTHSFITRAREIHGNKYDYSKVEYVNNKTKVCIICPEHGEFWQTPKNHLKGQGCNMCAIQNRNRALSSTTEDFIAKAKEVHGDKYDYSKVKYINANTEVCIIDKKYGEFWQKPCYHLLNKGCFLTKNTEDFITKAKEVHGNKYDYSKSEYKDANTKVCIICPEHGEFWQTPNTHYYSGCPKCAIENRSEKKKYTTEDFIAKAREIHENKYDYSNAKYIKSDKKIEIICPKHGKFYQIATEHLQGRGCPRCSHHVSNGEKEIIDFVNSLGLTCEKSNRQILNGKEIDIFIPSKNIAIEYDGLLWHSEKFGKDKNYHLNKTNDCEKHGIRLIHIFEDEWVFKQNIIKSMLRNIFGLTQQKIYARKCVCKLVTATEAMRFLDDNHIQGRCKAKYHYGLFYNNELVSLMTFGHARQQKKYNEEYDNTYELLRFCNKIDTSVIGGASKLLHHFINEISPKKIVTYADKRWSVGKLYDNLGFVHTHDSKPNYFYVIRQKRENRFKYRKGQLVKMGFDKNKSEHEIMLERDIYRIYDCGTKAFSMIFI